MSRFILKFLWLEKAIAVSLDQVVGFRNTPITQYFFWPRSDAWEEMKFDLEKRSWISQNDSILILNQITEVINFWQERNEVTRKTDLSVAKERFTNCLFVGRD
uniref:Small ribosomal subunit protein cS23 n=1 Tax=Phacus pleuronectes TaxID=102908 RepID=A0A3G3LLW2_9EUGL|nr:putative ribosomal protein 3 [Phacus pleuronectes]AYQ93699.1 putative ribosomal protein 3 [Phacus pleuronectes]